MEYRFKTFLIIGILIFILFISIGCDGIFGANGKVYEWENPPIGEHGEIYIAPDGPPSGLKLSPIAAKLIAFYDRSGSQGPGCSRPSPEYEQQPSFTALSDSNGKFEIQSVVSPGMYPMKIVINTQGYYSLEKEFNFDATGTHNFTFTVLLVRIP